MTKNTNTQNVDNNCRTKKSRCCKYIIATMVLITISLGAAYKFNICKGEDNTSISSVSKVNSYREELRTIYVLEQDSFNRDIDRMMNHMFNHISYSRSLFDDMDNYKISSRGDNDFPHVSSIKQLETEYNVNMTIPGFDKEQISVSVKNNKLTVVAIEEAAEQKHNNESNSDKRDHKTNRSFKQSLRLPSDIDQSAIKASLKNGILTIFLPRIPESDITTKTIDVE